MVIGYRVLRPGDAQWCAAAVLSWLVTMSVAAVNYSGLNEIPPIGAAQLPAMPTRTPLPDVCKTFSADGVNELVPDASLMRHVLDRNVSECEWVGPPQSREWASLVIKIRRAVLDPGESNEGEKAVALYGEALRMGERDGGIATTAKWGDVAAMIKQDIGSRLIIRDGLLVIEVGYAQRTGRSGEESAALNQAAGTLLRILPAKGN